MRLLTALALVATLAHGQASLLAVLDGREEFGRFGSSVTALDFNGDGIPDLFVGEPFWNRVYCWFGGTEFDTVPDLVFQGTAGTSFGTAIAAIGDINGDGIPDLAIGAPRDNSGGAGAGRVFIYYGSREPDTVPDLVLTGTMRGGRFGWSIAGGKDVNGDSHPDFLVGAPGQQRAFVFLGGNLLDTLPDLVLRNGNGDYFGGAVALPGDVTGNGYGDILVGDYRHTGPLLHGGGCFLYHGGEPLDPNLDQLWEGDQQNRQLGVTVCGPGDLNGNGYNDLALAGSYVGVVDLHWGGQTISNPPDLRLSGARRFGSALAGGMDLNRDGYPELLVGADGDDLGNPTGPGHAYVFLGGDPMSANPEVFLSGEAEGDMFGASIVLIGDINGNGDLEFAVGAPGHDSRGENAGRVYVYSYTMTGVEDEAPTPPRNRTETAATLVGRTLTLPDAGNRVSQWMLLNSTGRKVMNLQPGKNDVRHLAPGVYFVHQASDVMPDASSVHKVVVQR